MVLVVLFCLIFMARSRGTGHIVSQVNLCIIVCDVRLHSLLIEGFNTVYHNWLHPRPARPLLATGEAAFGWAAL